MIHSVFLEKGRLGLLTFLFLACWTATSSAQYGPLWWDRPYMPYQTRPPYPGALPLYYDGNIPVYDYTSNPGGFPSGLYNPSGFGVHRRGSAPKPTPRPIRRPLKPVGDFDNDGKPDKILPDRINIVPLTPEEQKERAEKKKAEREKQRKEQSEREAALRRDWKTKSGDVYENGLIFGSIDGQIGIRTLDGKRHYVSPGDLDEESKKAFEDWQQHKQRK